jgi:hypothetical protein
MIPNEIQEIIATQLNTLFNSIGLYSPGENNYYVAVNEILRRKADRPDKISFRLDKVNDTFTLVPHNLYTAVLMQPFITKLRYAEVMDKIEYVAENYGTIALVNEEILFRPLTTLSFITLTITTDAK